MAQELAETGSYASSLNSRNTGHRAGGDEESYFDEAGYDEHDDEFSQV